MKQLSILLIFFCLLSCVFDGDAVHGDLNEPEKNRSELQRTVDYFQRSADTLGLNSAIFLLDHMRDKYSGNGRDFILDIDTITSEQLIGEIKLACEASRRRIERGELSLDNFYEYVLPYKIGTEPINNWRQECLDRYGSKLNKYLENKHDDCFGQFTAELNSELMKGGFTFDSNNQSSDSLTWSELTSLRRGDCAAMAKTIVYPLRACGIPVAIDFITTWGNVDGQAHTWDALICSNGSFVPFLGFEGSPGFYDPFQIYRHVRRYPAKVYRKTFSVKEDDPKSEFHFPPALKLGNYIDVTDKYMSTQNIRLVANNRFRDDFLFLSVFSSRGLEPATGSATSGNTCLFPKMAENILYVPCSYDNRSGLRPFSHPFFINGRKAQMFVPNFYRKIRIEVISASSSATELVNQFGRDISEKEFYRNVNNILESKAASSIVDGQIYRLFLWNGRWVKVGEQKKCPGKTLAFPEIASGTIYAIQEADRGRMSRAFSYEGRKQIWW